MKTRAHSQRGSALLVTLLIITAVMFVLGSYLNVVQQNLRASNRSYHATAAMNVAEAGLEEAMWSMSQMRKGNGTAFKDWTIKGTTAYGTFSGFQLGTTTADEVKVFISDYTLATSSTPTIVARATLRMATESAPIEKWVEVKLKRSPSAPRGLVSKYTISFSGQNATVDSWNSDPDKDPTTAPLAYGDATKNDRGFVGSPYKFKLDTVNISNANIWGFVATYNDSDLENNVGPNGFIKGDDTPDDVKIDPTRVSTDFSADLPDIPAPAGSWMNVNDLGSVKDDLTLPRAGDKVSTDPVTKETKYYYTAMGIQMNNEQLSVTYNATRPVNDVVLIVPTESIDIGGGSGAVNIATGASLSIYAGGDVKIAGNGVANGTPAKVGDPLTAVTAQQPIKFQLYGTASDSDKNPTTASQKIAIAGNGALSGVIYAPNADLTINGNGDVLGSAVANIIKLTGNALFHYDESLSEGDVSGRLAIQGWRELQTPAERQAYAGHF